MALNYDVNKTKETTYPHVCGQCKLGFSTEQEYVAHECGKTGFTPADPEHLGEDFAAVSAYALKRGEIRKSLEDDGVDPDVAQERAHEEVAKMLPKDVLEPSE